LLLKPDMTKGNAHLLQAMNKELHALFDHKTEMIDAHEEYIPHLTLCKVKSEHDYNAFRNK